MTDAAAPRPARRWARPVVWGLLLVALSAPLAVAVGAVGTKLGLFDWRFGFGVLTVAAGPVLAIAGLIAAIAALVVAAFGGWRRLWPPAAGALLVAVVTLGVFGWSLAQASRVPPIHDYATSWSPPILPSPELARHRGPDANPILAEPRADLRRGRPEVENWADTRVSRIGADACPGARPVIITAAPAEAAARVKRVLEAEGLTLVTDTPGRLEAHAESFWYGFRDDVMFRIRPVGAGARVDMRSVSRVGVSDLGANCNRLTRLVQALPR